MKLVWGRFRQKTGKHLARGWLTTSALVAIYLGAIEPANTTRGIAQERGIGLAAESSWEPISLWKSVGLLSGFTEKTAGVVGGVSGEGAPGMDARLTTDSLPASQTGDSENRKMIRAGSMDMIVASPAKASDSIRQLTEEAGGFVVSSQTYGGNGTPSAVLTIRVPANKFEPVRSAIRTLGVRIESEQLEARDATKQYVDDAARLHSLRAEESQYLEILKQAKTVKDTVSVSEKLDEILAAIEQEQAELQTLSKQVETVALTISMRAEADAQVFGLHWRPLYQLKLAARQGLESISNYAAAMASFLFYLPTVLLWLGTILIGAAIGWRILRWAGKILFAKPIKAA